MCVYIYTHFFSYYPLVFVFVPVKYSTGCWVILSSPQTFFAHSYSSWVFTFIKPCHASHCVNLCSFVIFRFYNQEESGALRSFTFFFSLPTLQFSLKNISFIPNQINSQLWGGGIPWEGPFSSSLLPSLCLTVTLFSCSLKYKHSDPEATQVKWHTAPRPRACCFLAAGRSSLRAALRSPPFPFSACKVGGTVLAPSS